MKKYFLILIIAIIVPVRINALELTKENVYMNTKGVYFTEEEYDKLSSKLQRSTIEILTEKDKQVYLNNIEKIDFRIEYSATTEKIDEAGNVVESVTIPVTKETFEILKSDKNKHISENGIVFSTSNMSLSRNGEDYYKYQTSMKLIRMNYNYTYEGAGIRIITEVKWFAAPLIKQYDVLAVRWDVSKPLSNVYNYDAVQIAYDSEDNELNSQNYSLDGENMKRTTYGIGQSMNLFNTADHYEMTMEFELEDEVGEYAYATYQHARHSNANTLAISQAYTFSSNGLGGVLYYSNSTYRSYYDGMQGVYDDISSGEHFE